MERLPILVGQLYESMAQTEYFLKVPQVGRFIPLVSEISRLMESPLQACLWERAVWTMVTGFG